ncbi:MAG: signal recognition particle-docking protein FtsY, partial [Jatrophihabitantaceae bacterium]
MIWLWLVLAVVVVTVVLLATLVVPRRRGRSQPAARPGVDYRPGVGDDAELPRDPPTRVVGTVLELPV